MKHAALRKDGWDHTHTHITFYFAKTSQVTSSKHKQKKSYRIISTVLHSIRARTIVHESLSIENNFNVILECNIVKHENCMSQTYMYLPTNLLVYTFNPTALDSEWIYWIFFLQWCIFWTLKTIKKLHVAQYKKS